VNCEGTADERLPDGASLDWVQNERILYAGREASHGNLYFTISITGFINGRSFFGGGAHRRRLP
jgi:hypothetical protein